MTSRTHDANAPVQELPDDPALLKRMLAELRLREVALALEKTGAEVRAAGAQAKAAEAEVRAARAESQILLIGTQLERAQARIAALLRKMYGRKADRLSGPDQLGQLLLEFARDFDRLPVNPEDSEDAAPQDAAPEHRAPLTSRKRPARSGSRHDLSQLTGIPVRQHHHRLSDREKTCSCGCVKDVWTVSTWQLDYLPGHFERVEHVQEKCACRACDAAGLGARCETALKPRQPIEKSVAGPGLLAFIINSKFTDYTPLYRLEDTFERMGVEVSRGTMSVWCGQIADLVTPLYDLMLSRVRQSHVVNIDETPMPVLAKGGTHTGYMWVCIGDDAHPYNVYDFTMTRSSSGPDRLLAGFRGVMVADAYAGYNLAVTNNQIIRAGCWAHARRKFVEAEKTQPTMCREAVRLIGLLYGLEATAKGMNPSERLALRRCESAPIIERICEKFTEWKTLLMPKHPAAEAIDYALNQWSALKVFLDDGAVPIDNNVSERGIKRVVINRKNSLFVGNARGGRTMAVLASLTSTCRRLGIDPHRYLTHLMVNFADTPAKAIDEWLPDRWKAMNPDLQHAAEK